MNIFRVFDFLTKVGSAFSLMGELISRLGMGGRILMPPPSPAPDEESMSQDTSNSLGAEDEKPAEESFQTQDENPLRENFD